MDLPDDLVELILLRLASTVYLIRAASTCKQWRRIVAAADAGFLRRFRSLHAPAIAGYYYNSEKFTSFAPSSPSASASAPAIDDSHFSLDFLQVIVQDIVDGSRPQSSSSWRIMDSRGSLLLLDFAGSHPDDGVRSLLVCEPLTRRYQWVVPPSAGRGFGGGGCEFSRAYLADGAEADEAGGRVGMSNFRVVYELYHHHHGVSAAVFTFTTGGGAQLSWEEKAIGNIAGSSSCMHVLGHAGGSWYLYAPGGEAGRVRRQHGGVLRLRVRAPAGSRQLALLGRDDLLPLLLPRRRGPRRPPAHPDSRARRRGAEGVREV
ncbi:Os09g0323400 [Oryza sativa Japonica Group]|uniref:Os09g0323400 protein n=1 Tax=Oryza sativa subsp. japonica TaxID=39947 RepID=A0A0P0XLK6_ORYSJ|nr:Os09g0323400 [Oryza sativa Japonica Group]